MGLVQEESIGIGDGGEMLPMEVGFEMELTLCSLCRWSSTLGPNLSGIAQLLTPKMRSSQDVFGLQLGDLNIIRVTRLLLYGIMH